MEEVNVDTLGFSILKVDNIVEVENSYKSRIIVSSNKINAEEAYIRFFNSLFDIYKEDGFIVDFYINRLTKDEVNYLRSLLCEEDKLTLDKIVEYDLSGEFFKINSKELIDFFVRLSTREVFFISYYTKDFTIWGNYSMRFPIFMESMDKIQDCFNVLQESELYLERFIINK